METELGYDFCNPTSRYICHFWYLWCPGNTGLNRGAHVQLEQQHPLNSSTQELQDLKIDSGQQFQSSLRTASYYMF